MRRFPVQLFLPVLSAAILLGAPKESKAVCCLFDWWGAYRPTYSSYYAPNYSTYYSPSYYSAGYWPSTSYYASSGYGGCSSCCSTGNCGLQTSYSIPSCCSPCTSCAPCGLGCSNCASGDCGLASSSNADPTPANSRAGSSGQNPTFIDEEDRGMGSGYEGNPMNPAKSETDPGFKPHESDGAIDPLDQTFGTGSAGVTRMQQFKMPETVIKRREPAPTDAPKSEPTRKVNGVQPLQFPRENFDEKITSRSVTHRTRLVERRSWEQPVIAKNVTRQVPEGNLGWVPVPAPTQLVRK